ncbi:hypothetical protein Tsubulata_031965 [Turnera subulata]|uniref:DUF4283 domain-containing protein n=1 Tax=Turnera subulata TaxID=218843 RepID=A0A9Q0GA02_9ROSI|nr:hypothetical protein Tsubulata_031965 [Turnera subulata]
MPHTFLIACEARGILSNYPNRKTGVSSPMNAAEAVGVTEDDRSTKKVRIRTETDTDPMEAAVTGLMAGASDDIRPMEEEVSNTAVWEKSTVAQGAAAVSSPMEEEAATTVEGVKAPVVQPIPGGVADPTVEGMGPGASAGAGQNATAGAGQNTTAGRLSFWDILAEGRAGVETPVVTEVLDEEVQCEDGDIKFVAGKYGPAIRLSEAFKERLERRWDFAVVVKLLGRPIGYRTLCTRLQALWKPTRSIKIVDLENDFYLVRMDYEEDYYHALAEGPSVIMGHALSVQPWDSSFRASEGRVSQAVIWARFAEFPPSWYNSQVLHALRSLVGGAMKVDDNSKEAIRGKYARVAVEVDLQKPLRGIVEVGDNEFKVSYEGLPAICYHCGSVSHALSACPIRRSADAAEASSGSRQAPKPAGTGEWMNVTQRVRRRPRQEAVTPKQPPVATGSRFSETEVEEASHRVSSPRATGPQSVLGTVLDHKGSKTRLEKRSTDRFSTSSLPR